MSPGTSLYSRCVWVWVCGGVWGVGVGGCVCAHLEQMVQHCSYATVAKEHEMHG